MSGERQSWPRIGKFFLKPRGKGRVFYVCWYDPATRQTDGLTTGTGDLRAAELKLAEHAIRHERPVDEPDLALVSVLNTYWLDRGHHLPSASSHRDAMRDAILEWPDKNCHDLKPPLQRAFIAKLRARGLADSTIDRRLRSIWTAINYAKDNGELRSAPSLIGHEDWKPVLRARTTVLTLEELAQLLNEAGAKPEDQRYSREHWWRWLILAIGTGARGMAICELAKNQIVGDTVQLNPPGRRQTKKRRPTIPMAPTVAAWVQDWGPGYLVTYYDSPLATLEFFDTMREAAGIPHASPHVVRHTVATWLASQGVPKWDRHEFMGWKEQGSTTAAGYEHFDPMHMRAAAMAIERLFEALAPLVTCRDLLRRRIAEAQPEVWEALRSKRVSVPPEAITAEDRKVAELLENLEREKGLEPSTLTLARLPDS